ncbi:hypothetical protein H0H93_016877 [Arthromyces matolae]|nr:hypothetical protein H0H93_016877 [Arthromyces matolae]
MNLGSLLISVIISAVLLGVSVVQAFFYFNAYRNDRWYLRSLVGITVSLDTLHLALVTHTGLSFSWSQKRSISDGFAVYHYLVSEYGNREGPNHMVWSILVEVLVTGLTGLLVQSLSFDTFFELAEIKPLTLTSDALTAISDTLIAAVLCYFLSQSRTGFKRSDSVISKLILASPATLLFAAFYFNLGRLYTNSLLASLNARKAILASSEDPSNVLSSGAPPGLVNSRRSVTQRQIAINVTTTQEHRHQDLGDRGGDKIELGTISMTGDSDMASGIKFSEHRIVMTDSTGKISEG